MDLLVTPRHEPEYPDETGSNNFLEDSNSRKFKVLLNKTEKLKRLLVPGWGCKTNDKFYDLLITA